MLPDIPFSRIFPGCCSRALPGVLLPVLSRGGQAVNCRLHVVIILHKCLSLVQQSQMPQMHTLGMMNR